MPSNNSRRRKSYWRNLAEDLSCRKLQDYLEVSTTKPIEDIGAEMTRVFTTIAKKHYNAIENTFSPVFIATEGGYVYSFSLSNGDSEQDITTMIVHGTKQYLQAVLEDTHFYPTGNSAREIPIMVSRDFFFLSVAAQKKLQGIAASVGYKITATLPISFSLLTMVYRNASQLTRDNMKSQLERAFGQAVRAMGRRGYVLKDVLWTLDEIKATRDRRTGRVTVSMNETIIAIIQEAVKRGLKQENVFVEEGGRRIRFVFDDNTIWKVNQEIGKIWSCKEEKGSSGSFQPQQPQLYDTPLRTGGSDTGDNLKTLGPTVSPDRPSYQPKKVESVDFEDGNELSNVMPDSGVSAEIEPSGPNFGVSRAETTYNLYQNSWQTTPSNRAEGVFRVSHSTEMITPASVLSGFTSDSERGGGSTPHSVDNWDVKRVIEAPEFTESNGYRQPPHSSHSTLSSASYHPTARDQEHSLVGSSTTSFEGNFQRDPINVGGFAISTQVENQGGFIQSNASSSSSISGFSQPFTTQTRILSQQNGNNVQNRASLLGKFDTGPLKRSSLPQSEEASILHSHNSLTQSDDREVTFCQETNAQGTDSLCVAPTESYPRFEQPFEPKDAVDFGDDFVVSHNTDGETLPIDQLPNMQGPDRAVLGSEMVSGKKRVEFMGLVQQEKDRGVSVHQEAIVREMGDQTKKVKKQEPNRRDTRGEPTGKFTQNGIPVMRLNEDLYIWPEGSRFKQFLKANDPMIAQDDSIFQ